MKNNIFNHKIDKIQEVKEIITFKKSNTLNSTIITFLIILILGFIAYDYNMMNDKIQQKIPIIINNLDSLNLHIDEKMPIINESIEAQEKQLKILKNGQSILVIR